ncbi:hypothetical protein B0H16DRAFT_1470682 [Mycena metata]|uniref:Uncharacterized protein n=1 Tax=Mycena metata TaxID=1033252 RepID=A0AAD7HVI5_9AGAR|nr:hypothetical protein B0H16DRAFT_1470682 [Mycena metata]
MNLKRRLVPSKYLLEAEGKGVEITRGGSRWQDETAGPAHSDDQSYQFRERCIFFLVESLPPEFFSVVFYGQLKTVVEFFGGLPAISPVPSPIPVRGSLQVEVEYAGGDQYFQSRLLTVLKGIAVEKLQVHLPQTRNYWCGGSDLGNIPHVNGPPPRLEHGRQRIAVELLACVNGEIFQVRNERRLRSISSLTVGTAPRMEAIDSLPRCDADLGAGEQASG